MARRIYEDLKYIKDHDGTYEPNGWYSALDPMEAIYNNSDPLWNDMKKYLLPFMQFVPEIAHDIFGIEPVTQHGYTEKIQKLFPRYSPAKGVDDFLLNKDTIDKFPKITIPGR